MIWRKIVNILVSFLFSGLCLYFSYGMKHSNTSKSVTNKRRNQGASRPMVDTSSSDLLSSTQHRRERPNSLMLSPVPISSIPTDIDGGATNYSTPTFDLTNLSKNSDRLGYYISELKWKCIKNVPIHLYVFSHWTHVSTISPVLAIGPNKLTFRYYWTFFTQPRPIHTNTCWKRKASQFSLYRDLNFVLFQVEHN